MLDTFASRADQDLAIRWFAEPIKGKSHALNAALRVVRSDLVTFVDDDQRVDSDFLTATCAAAQQVPEADLFCGRLLPDWDGSEPSWVHDSGPYRIYPLPVPTFDLGGSPVWLNAETAIPSGGNFTVRLSWLKRVGDFSTDLGPVGHDLGGSEDSEWLLRALGKGAKLLYQPSIIQRHHIDPKRL
jgi:GT2 family glycosyltransferase